MKRSLTIATVAIGLLIAAPALSNTQKWSCKIKPVNGFERVMPKVMALEIAADLGSVFISDDIGKKIGINTVEGELKRRKGDVQKFSWQLHSIPASMKPTPPHGYGNKVLYRGTLDRQTGKLKIVGDFISLGGGSHLGNNMRGQGMCIQ